MNKSMNQREEESRVCFIQFGDKFTYVTPELIESLAEEILSRFNYKGKDGFEYIKANEWICDRIKKKLGEA